MSDTRATIRSARVRHGFFVVTSGALLAIVLIGFSPSFFLKVLFEDPGIIVHEAELLRGDGGNGLGVPELPLHVVAHGALMTAWMLLFFVQTLLITSDRRAVHQRLGVGGLFLAVGVVVSGVTAILLALPRLIALANPPDPSIVIAENLPAFSGDIGSFMAFSMAVGGAAYFRRRPETHKQLMLLASMLLIAPAITRIWAWSGLENAQEFWFPVTENGLAVLIIGGAWLTGRRPPWVLMGGLVLSFVVYGALFGLGTTDTALSWALEWVT